MNKLQTFTNQQFGEVRTIAKNGETWFAAVDVCKALDIANSRDAISRLEDDEKRVVSTDTPGGKQQLSFINEPGLYTLVLGSRKPEAKAFKRWITHEVIPSIRKTGGYGLKPMTAYQDEKIRVEKAKLLMDIAKHHNNSRERQALYSYAARALTGKTIIPLPQQHEDQRIIW